MLLVLINLTHVYQFFLFYGSNIGIIKPITVKPMKMFVFTAINLLFSGIKMGK